MNTLAFEKKITGQLDLSKEHHQISIVEATNLISRYNSGNQASVSFPKNIIELFINQNYEGLRFYFSQKNYEDAIVLVSAKKIIGTRYEDVTNELIAISTSDTLNNDPLNYKVNEADAKTYTNNYRTAGYFDGRKGGLFGTEAILELITKPDCVAVRFYNAKDDEGYRTIVLYGIDSNGNQITSYIADKNAPCPNYCSVNGL